MSEKTLPPGWTPSDRKPPQHVRVEYLHLVRKGSLTVHGASLLPRIEYPDGDKNIISEAVGWRVITMATL